MLRDISGRTIVSGLDGWYGFRLIPASNAHEVKGLEELAALVAAGGMPPDTPVVYATKRTSAPWPDVVVGVPLDVAELRAWQLGDRSVTRDVVEALEEAYEIFLAQAKANRVT